MLVDHHHHRSIGWKSRPGEYSPQIRPLLTHWSKDITSLVLHQHHQNQPWQKDDCHQIFLNLGHCTIFRSRHYHNHCHIASWSRLLGLLSSSYSTLGTSTSCPFLLFHPSLLITGLEIIFFKAENLPSSQSLLPLPRPFPRHQLHAAPHRAH